MPNAGGGYPEEQPDEAHAFGPPPLMAEWRRLRNRDETSGSRVDRAKSRVRRWKLEAGMLGEYRLILPPESYPMDEARRADHLRQRREALAEARRELGRAKRMRLVRRWLTLGLGRQ